MTGDFLTREIIRRMFGDVGVAPPPNFGKVGISTPELQLRSGLEFAMEDGKSQHFPIWAGEVIMDSYKIRAMLCDLSADEVPEYALVIRIADRPIYGIKLIYDDEDNGIFVIGEKNGWKSGSTIAKLRALIGMETIMELGMGWEACDDVKDLYEALATIAEM